MHKKSLIVFTLSLIILFSLPTLALATGGAPRLSDMGTDGDILTEATRSAIAFGSSSARYLVVWESNELGNMAPEKVDIFGQLMGPGGGEVGGNDFRISFQSGDSTFDNQDPDVVWNSISNEFLVVWEGSVAGSMTDTFQIFGQRINASTGALIGDNVQISDVGLEDFAFEPAVAFNARDDEYLVVWEGNVTTAPPNEIEIFGVRVDATTGGVLGPTVRLTHQGNDGDRNFDAENPRVAWNRVDNEYLVVFEGTHSWTNPLAEVEAYGQRVRSNGSPVGSTFRISAMGPEGDTGYSFRAFDPDIAFSPQNSEYLVTWSSADDRGALHVLDQEIFGQRLGALGNEIGVDDFRISFQGIDGDYFHDAEYPAVSWNGVDGSYLVVWQAPRDDVNSLLEFEIFARRLDSTGGADGEILRVSDMGPSDDFDFGAYRPAVAANPSFGGFFVTWDGDDDTAPLVDGEIEVFGCNVGQQIGLIFIDGFEAGNTSAWTSSAP